MPYHWTRTDTVESLTLWPHNSLTARGFVAFVGITSALFSVPLLATIGSPTLWALLPFMLAAIAAIWAALRRNNRDRQIREALSIGPETLSLTRQAPGQPDLDWQANRYWARPVLTPTGGPVPNYLTLRGGPREVELGAFLSEEERLALYEDLRQRLPGTG